MQSSSSQSAFSLLFFYDNLEVSLVIVDKFGTHVTRARGTMCGHERRHLVHLPVTIIISILPKKSNMQSKNEVGRENLPGACLLCIVTGNNAHVSII
jgi:hypothetical protein